MTDRLQQVVREILPNIPLTVISQGAEALVFETNTHPYATNVHLATTDAFIVKYRPSKAYRHPKIDASIIKSRTAGEVKFMVKLRALGINAPAVLSADFVNGLIWMEKLGSTYADGSVSSVKNYLWGLEKSGADCVSSETKRVCMDIGSIIAKLHDNDMIHGDLTTSNIILHGGQAYLIDFGLSSHSGMPEDKAVDLYVLERAVTSTHSVNAETYNGWMLEGYEDYYKGKGKRLVDVLRKLDEVRLRGRKRSMLG